MGQKKGERNSVVKGTVRKRAGKDMRNKSIRNVDNNNEVEREIDRYDHPRAMKKSKETGQMMNEEGRNEKKKKNGLRNGSGG